MPSSDAHPWPTPEPGETRVTLLGTVHLANPGNDEHNTDVDDTLAPARQDELETLCERLARRDFDRVALEFPRESESDLRAQYRALRSTGSLDAEASFPDGPARVRGEAAQVGFRIAAALDLDPECVHAVDSHPPRPDIDADWSVDIDADAVPYPVPDMAALVAEEQRRLAASTLLDLIREKNRESHLQTLHAGNVAASLSSSRTSPPDSRPDDPAHDYESEYVGSTQLGFWYERNARIVENLRRASDPGDETLFVVGASHVVPVRQIARGAPGCCPRSPLSLLSE